MKNMNIPGQSARIFSIRRISLQHSVFSGPHPGQRVLVVRVRELRGERRLRAQVHAHPPHLQPEVNTTGILH